MEPRFDFMFAYDWYLQVFEALACRKGISEFYTRMLVADAQK